MLSTQNRHDKDWTQQIMTDDRMITADRLRCKVSENNNWSPQQPEDLNKVLIKYQQHLTERPENAPSLNTNSRQKVAHKIVPIIDRK